MMTCPRQPNRIGQSPWRVGMVQQVDQQNEQFVIVRSRDDSCQSVGEDFKLAMPVVEFAAAAINHRPRPAVTCVEKEPLTQRRHADVVENQILRLSGTQRVQLREYSSQPRSSESLKTFSTTERKPGKRNLIDLRVEQFRVKFAAHAPCFVQQRLREPDRRCRFAGRSLCQSIKYLKEVPIANARGYGRNVYSTLYEEAAAFDLSSKQVLESMFDQDNLLLTVLSRTTEEMWPAEISAEKAEQAWRELQVDLATQVSGSTHKIVEGAGHFIHLDQPSVVVDAIRQQLTAVRQPDPSTPDGPK